MSYKIETLRDGRWATDGLGDEASYTYPSRASAEASIARLRECGPDWRGAEYRVVEVL